MTERDQAMHDITAIDVSLDEDKEFGELWREFRPEWKDDVPRMFRRRHLVRHKIITETVKQLTDGEHNPEVITEKVCESFILTLIISAALEALVKWIVQRIIDRWTD